MTSGINMYVFFLWRAMPVNREPLSIIYLFERVCSTDPGFANHISMDTRVAYTPPLLAFLIWLVCTDRWDVYARRLTTSLSLFLLSLPLVGDGHFKSARRPTTGVGTVCPWDWRLQTGRCDGASRAFPGLIGIHYTKNHRAGGKDRLLPSHGVPGSGSVR